MQVTVAPHHGRAVIASQHANRKLHAGDSGAQRAAQPWQVWQHVLPVPRRPVHDQDHAQGAAPCSPCLLAWTLTADLPPSRPDKVSPAGACCAASQTMGCRSLLDNVAPPQISSCWPVSSLCACKGAQHICSLFSAPACQSSPLMAALSCVKLCNCPALSGIPSMQASPAKFQQLMHASVAFQQSQGLVGSLRQASLHWCCEGLKACRPHKMRPMAGGGEAAAGAAAQVCCPCGQVPAHPAHQVLRPAPRLPPEGSQGVPDIISSPCRTGMCMPQMHMCMVHLECCAGADASRAAALYCCRNPDDMVHRLGWTISPQLLSDPGPVPVGCPPLTPHPVHCCLWQHDHSACTSFLLFAAFTRRWCGSWSLIPPSASYRGKTQVTAGTEKDRLGQGEPAECDLMPSLPHMLCMMLLQ